ncbi:MAG TPA: transglycosylase SLT domain-containing protein [Thermoanaerobaculia bacterium]
MTEDVRTICDCQVHARREHALWRRSVRATRRAVGNLGARSIALLVSVPLALGALDLPIEAMHLAITGTPEAGLSTPVRRAKLVSLVPSQAQADTVGTSSDLQIFTTQAVREGFLTANPEEQRLTLDMIKEQFFLAEVPYGSIIYREAVRNNLPPELVAAVVETESDFRPRLISHKNAQGLMQIIPSTAEFIGAGDLFNPAENIAAGTKYLRYLHNRFDGDLPMVLAAYNAGEGNVEKFGGIPPFPETINYLRKVNARTSHYRNRVRQNFVASVRIQNSQRAQ